MNNSLSTYVTVYRDVSDIVNNGVHYRNVAFFLPLTVSFNVSGHTDALALATDLLRLWDVLTGRDALVGKSIPGDVFLFATRSMAASRCLNNLSLRIVGLPAYPNLEFTEWSQVEPVISYLITSRQDQWATITVPVSMAEHFGNVARHAISTHVWIFGQGDFAIPAALTAICAIVQKGDMPDIISLPVGHSISNYRDHNAAYDCIQARHLESISGTLYRKEFLLHIPEHGKRWWPHIESVLQEARARSKRTKHLILGKGIASENRIFVYVAPNPNWASTQVVHDDVFLERYQVCLDSLVPTCDRYSWFYSLDDLRYAEALFKRRRMSRAELMFFWESISNGSSGPIKLQPGPAVIIPIDGDLVQQILCVATYFKMKLDGHMAYADFSRKICSEALSTPNDLLWPLHSLEFGLNLFDSAPAGAQAGAFVFEAGSAQLLAFGLSALTHPDMTSTFSALDVPTCRDGKTIENIEPSSYLCADAPELGNGVANGDYYISMLGKLSRLLITLTQLTKSSLTNQNKCDN